MDSVSYNIKELSVAPGMAECLMLLAKDSHILGDTVSTDPPRGSECRGAQLSIELLPRGLFPELDGTVPGTRS